MRNLALLVLLAPALAAPDARRVVHRGAPDLARALQIAAGAARQVALVVDATPYTALREDELSAALREQDADHPGRLWSIARLGEPLDEPQPGAVRLVGRLPRVFAEPTDETSTLAALGRTLRGARDLTAVFLADWRFEDHEGLEDLIEMLRGRRVTLSVVGSEAAFGRPWNDGFYPELADQVGRSAFGGGKPGVPFHTGDTAYPHLPWEWHLRWGTRFPSDRRPVPRWEEVKERRYGRPGTKRRGGEAKDEDLSERTRSVDPEAVERYAFPLPSSFGPYGLMRACGETGGRYVLWSWNPEGRSDVTYDFSRCDLFAPDLRATREILGDRRGRPLAKALARAWHEIVNRDVQVALTTPPVTHDARAGLEMDYARGDGYLPQHWPEPRDWKLFLKRAPRVRAALDRALGHLHRALLQPPRDNVDRRLRADADLLKHTLLVLRFQLGEAVAAAEQLPPRAWRDEGLLPGLDPDWWLPPGPDVVAHAMKIADPAAGDEVLKDRERMLQLYTGTPFGEQVRRNGVFTYKLAWRPVDNGRPARNTPAESNQDPPSTPPGGGSTGGGPTTGG